MNHWSECLFLHFFQIRNLKAGIFETCNVLRVSKTHRRAISCLKKKAHGASGVRNSPQHQTASLLSEASSRGHQLEQAVLQELIIADFVGKFSQWDVKGDVGMLGWVGPHGNWTNIMLMVQKSCDQTTGWMVRKPCKYWDICVTNW